MFAEAQILERLSNRQVILNYYEEDGLIAREGFQFQQILLEDPFIRFTKEGLIIYTLDISNYTDFVTLKGFNHYYAFIGDHQKVELYFPN